MKVLVVTFEFVPFSGGIAYYTQSIAKGLADLHCDVRVLAPRYPHDDAVDGQNRFHTVRMDVSHGTGELTRFVPGLRYLNEHIRQFDPDVALLTSDLAHGIGSWACKRSGVPFVTVVHGSEIVKHFPPRNLKQVIQSRWLRWAYTNAGAVFCVSHFVKSLMVSAGFDERRLMVVHNGVDDAMVETRTASADVAAVRTRYGLDGKLIILTLARLVPRKGQAQMIRAMPAILERYPNACYVIAGTGEESDRLKALAKDLAVDDAVVLTGEVPAVEKIPLLDLCDVYVLPSLAVGQRVEGLGIAVLEAAARARPVIGTRHGGIGEIIEDGVTGYLVDEADPAQLAARVLALLNDRPLAKRLGAAARERVQNEFLATHMSERSKHHLARVRQSAAGTSRGDRIGSRSTR